MSSPVVLPSSTPLPISDQQVRQRAIDPAQSFTVRAPAGSGKTELLIQRYLALLARVQRPEAIVAITFTKKAAGEMLGRVMDALREASEDAPLDKPHKQKTRDLALAALARDRQMSWNLLEHAGRLRIQTIDSLCMSIASEMPWLSRLGAMPRIEEDTRTLYRAAAGRTLVETAGDYDGALETVLEHLDNNAADAQKMIAEMLAKREQWLALAHHSDEDDRARFEDALGRTVGRRLRAADEIIPHGVRAKWLELARFAAANGGPWRHLVDIMEWPAVDGGARAVWQQLAELLLTKSDTWRRRFDITIGFPANYKEKKREAEALAAQLQGDPALLPALLAVRQLPPARYSDQQWTVLRSLLQTLRVAVAQLRMVFRENNVIDFAELSIAASKALGDEHQPTDLAFRLDSRIEHLLIDEFQDTSRAQFDLLRKLTADWDGVGESNDARTLFLVGDPMQSIYRFRQAEVGLFMRMESSGLGALRPQPLQLTTNYRSVPAIVQRVNRLFADVFPQTDEIEIGAVRYSESQAVPLAIPGNAPAQRSFFDPPEATEAGAVTCDFFIEKKNDGNKSAENTSTENTRDGNHEHNAAARRLEAQCVLERIQDARTEDAPGSIGILVRARAHLPAIISALKMAGIGYRAVEIDPLNERMVVRDLLSLTRAMLHLADRISWLAVLRAPWCGLTLDDLEALVRQTGENAKGPSKRTIWECLHCLDASGVSDDGRVRARRVCEILTEAFAEQGRWSLRRWVERTWIKLGGPAVIAADFQARRDADAFFQLLEKEQRGADLADLEQFAARVAEMTAPPASDESTVQIMTIHKAKGLEFDTVILPGLGRPTKKDDDALVLFHEWSDEDDDSPRILMAPIHETAGEQDPIYKYLKSLEAKKSVLERQRQLYVAMTRAKKRLHLMGAVIEHKDGDLRPVSDSMLGDIWPGLNEEERACIRSGEIPNPNAASRRLLRLPAGWSPPDLPRSFPPSFMERNVSRELAGIPHQPTFEWVGESLRHAGTVVHSILQRMKPGELKAPEAKEIRAALLHAGVSPHEVMETSKRVERAIRSTLQSERGRWILAGHDQVRTEYALAAVVEGEIVRGVVDRTFVERTPENPGGVRWVVDFKTSAHEGAGMKKFLDEQQRRYRDQMERYAKILRPLGQPVRLGLYFPLLDQWKEWVAGD